MFGIHCRRALFCLFTPMLVCAGTTVNPSLTVLMDFEAPHSETSLTSLRTSLNHLLAPSGLDVDVKLRADLPENAEFGELVVFKMRGSCNMVPGIGRRTSNGSGPLAMAYTSDGRVLHFGEVECDRVRSSLQHILGRNGSVKGQQAYGSALAVVIAHEVYHMLGNVRKHTHSGLTKSSLSAAELTDFQLAMPPPALAAIEKSVQGGALR